MNCLKLRELCSSASIAQLSDIWDDAWEHDVWLEGRISCLFILCQHEAGIHFISEHNDYFTQLDISAWVTCPRSHFLHKQTPLMALANHDIGATFISENFEGYFDQLDLSVWQSRARIIGISMRTALFGLCSSLAGLDLISTHSRYFSQIKPAGWARSLWNGFNGSALRSLMKHLDSNPLLHNHFDWFFEVEPEAWAIADAKTVLKQSKLGLSLIRAFPRRFNSDKKELMINLDEPRRLPVNRRLFV